jgi:hypothetical protein
LSEARENEVAFCADVKSWLDALFQQHPEWPFERAHIEQYGRGTDKRQDLRILGRGDLRALVSGEVKMPGTAEGRTPYDRILMEDAFLKAKNIQAPFFFTWNVNRLVMFDSRRWDVPLMEMRLRDWELGLRLSNSGDCRRSEVRAHIRDEFLPKVFGDIARIVAGTFEDWGIAPDEIFLRSLESHLDWPVEGTRDYLAKQCRADRTFMHRLWDWMARDMQWTFNPDDEVLWRDALDRAARTLCYVFSNRAIFHKALQARYPKTIEPLGMPFVAKNHLEIYEHFREQFRSAVEASGDYEPVFYPQVGDWYGSAIFASPTAVLGWKGFFVDLDAYDFRTIPHDIIGGVFKKLIAPEERQKFGQFFTHQDIVDVINAFCIRRGGDTVLDPSCGSGSFLVRAYHRKAWLSEQKGRGQRRQDHHKPHQELLREIFGCDIAVFPAHLATLNLAAREIRDEENYPLIRRGNFFEAVEKPEEFCRVPGPRGTHGRGPSVPVPLPELDAVIGNPPYVRQELIPKRSQTKPARNEPRDVYESRLKNTKEYLQSLVSAAWPGLKLSGRSDLHCYFWPVAAKFLKEGGYFGFLTSSSWLDVEYGFALQGWILQNFKLLAVLESVDEPWFEDARIKTVAAILQRCSDQAARDANIVKFVRLQKPLSEILGDRAHGDEAARQKAVDQLRVLIDTTDNLFRNEKLRIIPVPQRRLWEEGVQAARLLCGHTEAGGDTEEEEQAEHDEGTAGEEAAVRKWNGSADHYVAGKWGRFLRAPDIYFRLMRDYGSRFVKLGEIAEVRFGIKSGCDAFFMPRDVTAEVLAEVEKGLPWNHIGLMSPCRLNEVQSGRVRLVRAGDNTLHPVEAEYLRPEVHSLMEVDRPVVWAGEQDRVVLWVGRPLRELAGTHVAKYIRWGAKQTFASRKSKPVPVPQRSTVAARPLWYNLTGGERGVVFWPKAQKYRHIVPGNPDSLVCNCNLYDVHPLPTVKGTEKVVLPAILNSTLVGLFKHFYGRYAGAEGTLKTEVVDVLLMDVPNPTGVPSRLAKRMAHSLQSMMKRETTHLVEDELLRCHRTEHLRELLLRPPTLPQELQQTDRRDLDDSVLELIGVTDPHDRAVLLDELYRATAEYHRYLRTQDIQTMENRGGENRPRFSAEEIAASIWDSLADEEKGPSLRVYLAMLDGDRRMVMIYEGKATALGSGHLYCPAGVVYTIGKSSYQEEYANVEQARLVVLLAEHGIRERIELPPDPATCEQWREAVMARLLAARKRFQSLAGSRTGSDTLQEATADLLMQWFIHGR